MKPKKNKTIVPKSKKNAKEKKSGPGAEKSSTTKKTNNVLRGMHDILPKEEKYWRAFYRAAQNLADYFQFGRIETPLLEESSLFVRSVGRGTDIVDKEMYIFEDRDGAKVALRPEGTAGVARAYIGNGMWNLTQPVKVWYVESMFRHERPQSGRYREHHQIGFETIGAKDPALDAELILIAYSFYKDLGVPVEVHINSLGTPEERARYINELVSYYRSKRSYLCENCRLRITKNPLRLLDCKEPSCQPVKEAAPQLVDWLGEESKNFFMKVLEYLDELEIPYQLTPTLVRGLDYYTHTVFELVPNFIIPLAGDEPAEENKTVGAVPSGAQSSVGAGGRYDLLVEDLGGRPTPAAGFGIGIERAISALKQYNELKKTQPPVPEEKYDVYFAQLGGDAKRTALKMINDLRMTDIRLAFNLYKNSLKNQLELANSLKVAYVVILGQKEVQDKTVIIRDMESGVQEIVDQKKLEMNLRKKLKKI